MLLLARDVMSLLSSIGTQKTVPNLPGVYADMSSQMYVYDTSRFSEYKDR